MNDNLASKLDEFITEGTNSLSDYTRRVQWVKRVSVFLKHIFGDDTTKDFNSVVDRDGASAGIGLLDALLAKMLMGASHASDGSTDNRTGLITKDTPGSVPKSDKKVFLVHGHDIAAKETVARFIERIGLSPIILHEQPNIGRTVIEKFEMFSDVHYAVVLLTPDDLGYPADEPSKISKRARQNVVLELGYFLGKLGRDRVAALYKHDVEIPSDYQGVVYINLDEGGAWKTKLAQEFVQGGLSIKLEGLI